MPVATPHTRPVPERSVPEKSVLEKYMRAASRALLALALAIPAGTARAQVQQNDPNAANASFALQSQIRTLNQQRVTDFNTLNQSIQRNAQSEPYGAYLPYRGLRGGLHGEFHGGFHGVHAGRRIGRPVGRLGPVTRGGGINTSVCIGC